MLLSSYLKFCRQCQMPSIYILLTLTVWDGIISHSQVQRYNNYLKGKSTMPQKHPPWGSSKESIQPLKKKTTQVKFNLILPTLISDVFPNLCFMSQIYFNSENVKKDLRYYTSFAPSNFKVTKIVCMKIHKGEVKEEMSRSNI